MNKGIGGFFELEIEKHGDAYHENAIALSTGRSCIGFVLDQIQPKKVYVPDYNCFAVFQPMIERGIEFEPYFVDDQLDPIALPVPGENELLIYVNYFGLKNKEARILTQKYGQKVLIDDTHRFFHKGYKGSFSFTSARKYFGVPDGAYLFSDFSLPQSIARNSNITIDHNMLRLCGEQEKAFEIFKEHEASFDGQTRKISRVSEILLSNLNYKQISQRRLDNFETLHEELRGYNALDIDIARMEVPFCYPLMPKTPMDKKRFYENKVFVPNYWPDVLDREFSSVNAKKFSLDLLPLPIDHRYGKEEMDFIIKIVKDFGKQG